MEGIYSRKCEKKYTDSDGLGSAKTETPLEWVLKKLIRNRSEMGYFYPTLVRLAEVVLSFPVTNAWPERGVSAMKRIKTRLRNRLKNDMLNTLMQWKINGPPLIWQGILLSKQLQLG